MSLAAVILAPLFAQIALTFVLLFWMGALRVGDIRAGRVKPQDIALSGQGWPPRTAKVANCFANQFEAPVLFYVLTALQWSLGIVDQLSVNLAWAFVLSRYVHAAEFTTSNVVIRRGAIFAVGMLILLADWVVFALHVFSP